MATGVLVLCLGKATRLIPFIEEMGGVDAKEYEAHIRFGFEMTTDDAEGEPRGEPVLTTGLNAAGVRAALAAFVGELDQVPPAVSAKKVAGERAYAIARRGEDIELKPARVYVGTAELLGLDGDIARVRFACSRGTYIRALARDLGRALGMGAHLVALRRTRSGAAEVGRSIRLGDLTTESLGAALIPMMAALETWPSVAAGDREAADLRLGRAVNLGKARETAGARVRICDREGRLVALASSDGSRMQPFCVF
jgi:tRNA pseudouridine55 synthase